ncbi:MAG TPA: RDD family protein [Longimicrobiales bacterium]
MTSGRRLTDLEPAGLTRRAAAFMLDLVVAAVVVVALLQLVLDPLRQALGPGWMRVGAFYVAYVLLTVSLPIWLYFSGYESSPWQATPGKRWLGIRVNSVDGRPVSFVRAFLRTLVKLLPFEIAHICMALPANPFVDPITGELTIPALDAMHPISLAGLLAALLLFGLLLFTAVLHPDGRGAHDMLAGTFVVRTEASAAPQTEPVGV